MGERQSISEDLIMEAGWFEMRMPRVVAQGMRGWWPPMDKEKDDYIEVKSYNHFCGRADVYDFVMLDMLGPKSVLSVRDKRLVWARAGLRWKWTKIVAREGGYRQRLAGSYSNCLILLDLVVEEKKKLTKFSFLT